MLIGLVLAMLMLAPGAVSAADVAVVTHGDAVDLGDHLVPGKYVLFDFYADWCGPCRQVGPYLERLASEHENELALRKVDIVNWSSPVAGQYRIHSIPHLKLFGPGGDLVAEGDAGRVVQVLEQALGGGAVPVSPGSRHHGAGAAVMIVFAVVAVAAWLVGSDRRRRAALPKPPDEIQMPPGDGAARVWYAMVDGSLVGPYTPYELAELSRTARVGSQTRVRRKGDAGWHALSEVASSE